MLEEQLLEAERLIDGYGMEVEAPSLHPMARFVEIDDNPKPPRWLLPGVIPQGLTMISGSQGVGKTTAVLPLAMVAAGLFDSDLAPHHWRHVIYVTEDVDQANRIVSGIARFGGRGIKMAEVRERLHLV